MRKPSVLFIFLIVAAYIIAPALDVFACDGCNNAFSLRAGQESPSTDVSHADSPAHGSNTEPSNPADQGTMNDLCPLCSNAASQLKVYECSAPVFSIHRVSSPTLLALLDPSYPINKPPQN